MICIVVLFLCNGWYLSHNFEAVSRQLRPADDGLWYWALKFAMLSGLRQIRAPTLIHPQQVSTLRMEPFQKTLLERKSALSMLGLRVAGKITTIIKPRGRLRSLNGCCWDVSHCG